MLKEYFLKKLSNVKKYNLDIETFFLEFRDLLKSNKYPVIICTDLNNNVFSKNYDYLVEDHQDSFIEKGSGFGATYKFPLLPMRIDFIFASRELEIIDFETHLVKLSDHKPISVMLEKN